MSKRIIAAIAALLVAPHALAQETTDEKVDTVKGRVDAIEEQLAEAKGTLEKLTKLKLSGYVQARYQVNEAANPRATSSGAPAPATGNEGFGIRRGRLKTVYDAKTSEYVLQIDATPTGVSLKSAEAVLKLPWIGGWVLVGQTEFPFGYEVQASSSDLALLERSRAIRAFLPGEYDRGVKAYGRLGFANLKVGVLNGNSTEYVGYTFRGRNVDARPTGLDNDRKKDVMGRLGFDLGFLVAGVSGSWGQSFAPAAPASGTGASALPALAARDHNRTRVGADVQLYLDLIPLGGTSVKGEYIAGKAPFASGREQIDVSAHGWYVQLQQAVGTKLELAARFDSYDPRNGSADVSAASGRYASAGSNRTDTIAYGFHYHLDGNLKLSAVHEIPRTKAPAAVASNPLRGDGDPPDQLFTAQLQAKF